MRTFLWSLLIYVICCHHSQAILTIDITGGIETGGQPIAIVPFAKQANLSTPPQDIAKIITNNLYRSGRFAPMPTHILPEQPAYIDKINFAKWEAVGIPNLVIGRIAGNITNGYIVEFELFDILRKERVIGFRYTANLQTLRQVAHQISDSLYQALIGEAGIFSTQIVYVTLQRHGKQTNYHLYIADADGANPRLMLKTTEPIFSPSWSPDGQHIAYVTYDNYTYGKRMAVYIQHIRTGKRNRVSARRGLNTAPAWAPNGRSLALTLSHEGNPEIYLIHLYNSALTRLTNHPAIDTEPEWAADGQSLVFTSDRSGKPQIYRKTLNGGGIQRLTFQGSYNARPRLSPDGNKLALLHNGGNGYQIAVLDLDNAQLQILSKTTLDESPSFAPNGSMIIYADGSSLAAVSIDGQVHQRLVIDMGAEVREPAWSPFIQ